MKISNLKIYKIKIKFILNYITHISLYLKHLQIIYNLNDITNKE